MHEGMKGLTWIDWTVLLAYLVGISLVGVWTAKRVKSAASYFISDRRSGKLMMMFFTFGAGTHADQAVGVAAKTFTSGASGIWYQWLWLPVTPFYWLIAPLFRRMRAVTTGDYFDTRYSGSVGVLYAVVGMLQLMISIGVMLKGAGAMVEAVSGGAVSDDVAIWGMTVLFVVYGMAGGLNAAIITDLIQGVLTIVLSFLILPFALEAVGGLEGLRVMMQDPAMFEIVAPGEIGVFYIIVIAFNGLVGWVTQPHSMATGAAGSTEMAGRWGVTGGSLIKRVCTIAWVLTGLVAIGLYQGTDIHIDQVYGAMAGDLLPVVAPGLVGLFIAALLAAVMSSCDVFMVTSSALFTQNIYRRYVVTGRQDGHYLRVGRAVSLLVVLVGIVFAFTFASVVEGLEVFWAMQAMMGIPFWIGLYWRRATPEQQKRFLTHFHALALRSYATALTANTDIPIEYLPMREESRENFATVRTVIPLAEGDDVKVNYRLYCRNNAWKLFDVNIAGISMVITIRSAFLAEVVKSGLDGLIEVLEQQSKEVGT